MTFRHNINLSGLKKLAHNKAFLISAAVAVFVFTYAMILYPASAQSTTVYCGEEEHEHTDACYTTEKTLTCDLEENDGHQHSEDCYETSENLICGQEESDEHQHTEDCYETEQTLICGMEEGEGAHHHTEDCYTEEEVLSCGMEEHTHTLSCYSNPDADVETESDWTHTFSGASLTGNWAEDALTIARTQLGYAESSDNYQVVDDDVMKGYSRYGAWYGDAYGDWSAMFADFCISYAGIPTTSSSAARAEDGSKVYMPVAGDCREWVKALKKQGLYETAADNVPDAGDLVFLCLDGGSAADHVGLIAEAEKNDDGTLKSIQAIVGDLDDTVECNTYSGNDAKILGYGRMPENPAYEEAEEANDSEVSEETAAAVSSDSSEVSEETETAASSEISEEAETAASEASETTESAASSEITEESETSAESEASEISEEAATGEDITEESDTVESLTEETESSAAEELEEESQSAPMLSSAMFAAAEAENTSFEDAYALEAGDSLTTQITSAGQCRYYVIKPERTGDYTFQTSSSYDTYGYLYDESHARLAYNDDGAGNRQFLISQTLEAGKTYYLGVKLYSSSATTTTDAITVIARAYFEEGNTSQDTALSIAAGDTVSTKITEAGQKRYFTITPTESGTYYFISQSDGTAYDTIAYLYDADGNQLSSDDNSAGSSQFSLGYALEAGKTYYLAAGLTSSTSTTEKTFSVTCWYDPGNTTFDAALPLAVWSEADTSSMPKVSWDTVSTSLTKSGQYRYFVIDAEKSGDYSFKVTSAKTTDVYLYNEAHTNNISYAGSSTSNTLTYTLTAGKRYYLGIKSSSSSSSFIPNMTVTASAVIDTTEWSISEDGVLTVSNPNGMKNYTSASATPWYSRMSEITSVVVADGTPSVGSYAFSGLSNVTSIKLPDSVTSIGDYAFRNSDGLTSFTVSDHVTSLGKGVFYDCDGLTSVTLPKDLTTIPAETFYSCDSLKDYTIPSTVTAIGSNAFQECKALTALEIPANVTSIGDYAFKDCDGLTSMTVPDTVTSLGTGVFYDCDGLTSVTLPKDLTKIPDYTFYSCDSLADYTIPSTITAIGNYALAGCKGLEELAIPANVTTIGNYAFRDCDGLTSFTLPSTVTSLGTGILYDCDGLTSVNLPENLTTIPNYTFYSCDNLADITLPSGLTSIGKWAFENCKSLKNIDIPNGVTSVYDCAFRASGLTSVTLPASVNYMGTYAFNDCDSLKTADLSQTALTEIASYAFLSCDNLEEVKLPETVTKIGYESFQDCTSLETINIPDSVTTISQYAFKNCDSLTSVTIPDSVTSLETSVFYDCDALQSVTLPSNDSIKKIPDYSFYSCDQLTDCTIPENITEIGSHAFDGCTSMTSLTLQENISQVDSYAFNKAGLKEITFEGDAKLSDYAFANNSSLTSIKLDTANLSSVASNAFSSDSNLKNIVIGTKVDTISSALITALKNAGSSSLNFTFEGPNAFTSEVDLSSYLGVDAPAGEYYADASGVLYRLDPDTKTAVLVKAPSGLTDYSVPEKVGMDSDYTVTSIGSKAFKGNTSLTSITVADTVTSIGAMAFQNCSKLAEATVPETTTSIGAEAFQNCTALTSFNGKTSVEEAKATLPKTSIGGFALDNTGLTAISITPDGDYSQIGLPGYAFEDSPIQISMETTTSTKKDPNTVDNTLLYYTGETATTTISVSNPDSSKYEEGTIVRFYLMFDDSTGSLNYKPGDYTYVDSKTGEKTPFTVGVTDIPNCYYVDVARPAQGSTVSISLAETYPSPTSGGGTEKIWAEILSADEYKALGTGVTEPTSYQLLKWDTKPDTFPVSKTVYSTTPTMVGDGNKDGTATVGNLAYYVSFSRTGDTLYVGKDYMKSVDFTDVLTLPDGFTYSDAVMEAIKAGNLYVSSEYSNTTYNYYAVTDAGKVLICQVQGTYLNSVHYVKADTIRVQKNEAGQTQLVTTFHCVNTSSSTEISTSGARIYFYNIQVKESQLEAGQTYSFPNTVTGVEHFNYSEDQVSSDSASKSLSVARAYPSISKTPDGSTARLGSSAPFTVAISNNFALPCQITHLDDNTIPRYYYIPASGIQQMFTAARSDENLTVTIENATLCKEDTAAVTGTDGNEYTATINDTWTGSDHNGMEKVDQDSYETAEATITFTKEAGSSLITMTTSTGISARIGTGGDYESVSAALDAIHYKVTYNARYQAGWTYADGTVLYGGETRSYSIPAVMKDTFMLLTQDEKYSYQGGALGTQMQMESEEMYNTAALYYTNYGSDTDSYITDNGYYNAYRDFTLTKGCKVDGETPDGNTTVTEGSTVDYTVSFSHSGSAYYAELPLVDHMYGSQALLAPVSENSSAAWAADCETYTAEDGTAYYVLSEEGTYENVMVGGYLADRVEVTKPSGGCRDTLIYWYFTGITDSASRSATYKSLVCPEKLGLAKDVLTYSLGNEAWLGDYQGHRLYATLDIGGKTVISGNVFAMDKSIVDETSATSGLVYGNLEDWDYTKYSNVSGYDYCQVSEGETVVYRLRLKNLTEDGITTLHGGDEFEGDLWDYLPAVTDNTKWSKDNVSICYNGFDSVSDSSADGWDIVEDDDGEMIIQWDEDFSLTFSDTADIYVTVKFPANTDTNTYWDEYAKAYGAQKLVNTFKVLNVTDSVTHDLVTEAKVRLQKGVAYTGSIYYQGGYTSGYNSLSTNTGNMSRFYYSNNDESYHFVQYYATLCNEGDSNLYLTELVDVLPRGFTYFEYKSTSWSSQSSTYGLDGNMVITDADGTVTKVNTSVSASTETDADTGIQTVHFKLGSATSSSYASLSYDSTEGKYYLKPGQALGITYRVLTNDSEDTDDEAVNSISMPYYDYNGGGVNVGNSESSYKYYSYNLAANDGDCEVIDNGTAKSMGLTGGSSSTQWLTSSVSLYRGSIQPGITKKCSSTTSEAGTVTNDPVSASPEDTVTWTVTAENSGAGSLEDYVITDVMGQPYVFTGAVSFNLYNASNLNMLYTSSLFTITENTGSTVTVKCGSTTKTLQVNAEDYTDFTGYASRYLVNSGSPGSETIYLGIRFSTDDSGNQVMNVRFKNSECAIPGGGKAVLKISTKNNSGSASNRSFDNNVYITPMKQTWDHSVSQGNYTSLTVDAKNTDMPSVQSASQITVATGYATSSLKSIEEKDNSSNAAKCTDSRNYIALDDKTKLFTYTLAVNNTTTKGMDELILIDNLPEPDDHSTFMTSDKRNSDFKVSLAADPAFTVSVKTAKGTTTTLDKAYYTIQLNTRTSFTSDDWSGKDAEDWIDLEDADADTIANARSFRFILKDTAGTQIPAQATVSIRFDGRIDDESAAPGEIAWNSFGYHYSLVDVKNSLEAAPLKVGILVPSVPSISKSLQYQTGTDYTAEQDMTFRYILYSGAKVDLSSCSTDAERYAKLKEAGRQIAYLERTVKTGESASGTLKMAGLQLYTYDADAGWQATEGSSFTFAKNTSYTLYEIPENADFSLNSVKINDIANRANGDSFTFTYNDRNNQNLTVVNTHNVWKVKITKTDSADNTVRLADAVFGVYSPDASEKLNTSETGFYERELEKDGKTYYLCRICTTAESGIAYAENLLGDTYLLKELEAPDEYQLSDEIFELSRTADYQTVSVTVEDFCGYELPKTGGSGTRPQWFAVPDAFMLY